MNLQSKIRTRQFEIDEETNSITFLDNRYYFYEPTQEYFPSVTTRLDGGTPKDPFLLNWIKSKGEDADRIKQEAAERGSIIHKLTEQYDMGMEIDARGEDGNPRFTTSEWKQFERYVAFSDKFKPEIIFNEYNLVSPILKTGGTCDRYLKLTYEEGTPKNKQTVTKRLIVDIKSSNQIQPEYFVQVNVYRKMHEELFPEHPVDDVAILWLNSKKRTDKEGELGGKGWELLFPPNPPEYYLKLWDSISTMYDWKCGDNKPNNVTYNLKYKKKW